MDDAGSPSETKEEGEGLKKDTKKNDKKEAPAEPKQEAKGKEAEAEKKSKKRKGEEEEAAKPKENAKGEKNGEGAGAKKAKGETTETALVRTDTLEYTHDDLKKRPCPKESLEGDAIISKKKRKLQKRMAHKRQR